jgi:Uma2 family endonuclease
MTINTSIPSSLAEGISDPFQYGWRYVKREVAGGEIVFDEVPLTLEDVLYPEEGDRIMHNVRHNQITRYLTDALAAHFVGNPDVAVHGDVRVSWKDPGMRANGPDVIVAFGVHERRNWSTFPIGRAADRPVLVIEVTSPETRNLDLFRKVEIYAQAQVEYYLIVDVRQRKDSETIRLIGYHLDEDQYLPLLPDARGWYWIEPIGLWLGIEQGEVYLFTQANERFFQYEELSVAYAEIQERVSDAEQRANEAEQRISDAEQRVSDAEQRARQETATREQAEARIKELEEALRRMQTE